MVCVSPSARVCVHMQIYGFIYVQCLYGPTCVPATGPSFAPEPQMEQDSAEAEDTDFQALLLPNGLFPTVCIVFINFLFSSIKIRLLDILVLF